MFKKFIYLQWKSFFRAAGVATKLAQKILIGVVWAYFAFVFSGLAFQIGVLMFLMTELGSWIETKILSQNRLPTLICSLIGLFVLIYLIKKQNKNL